MKAPPSSPGQAPFTVYKGIPGYFDYGTFQDHIVATHFRTTPTKNMVVCLEIGTLFGASAASLYETLLDHGLHPVITTLDTFSLNNRNPDVQRILNGYDPYQVAKDYLKPWPQIVVLKHDSIDFLEGASNWDFIWLDGNHEYDQVTKEISLALHAVAPGGILAGHDYAPHCPGVIKAVDELIPDRLIFGNCWYKIF